MQADRKQLNLAAGAGIVGALLIALLIALVVVYTGAYNVAATKDHTPLVRWAFTTTMKNSVEQRAAEIEAPERFTQAMIASGAGEYQVMCQHCHGGPGVERDTWAQGLLPRPPHLPDVVAEWQPNEVFWLLQHGLKMTGMPAFGPTHDDAVLWDITAFVVQLPGMTAEEYAGFEGDHGEQQGH